MLNGRFDPALNNYTFIHGLGKSVVDYICVPQDFFSKCDYFKVIKSQDIVDQFKLHNLLGNRSKLPDHAFIMTQFSSNVCNNVSTAQGSSVTVNTIKYKLNRIPNDLFQSDISKTAILQIITDIEQVREVQSEIDGIYDNMCSVILQEMKNQIPQYCPLRSTRKRYKHCKPY